MKRILEFIEMVALATGIPALIFIGGPVLFGAVVGFLMGVK